jgi:hypothetical protein
MSNKRLSAICAGTIPSAQKIGWLTYLRDTQLRDLGSMDIRWCVAQRFPRRLFCTLPVFYTWEGRQREGSLISKGLREYFALEVPNVVQLFLLFAAFLLLWH